MPGDYGSMGAGIGQSVMGNIQMLVGYYGAKKAEKKMAEDEKNRPVYSRPEEVKQYLELAKNQAGSQMPGTSQAESNIQQTGQAGIKNIQNMSESPTSSIGAMQDLYRSEMNAYNNLAVKQQQYYTGQQQNLQNALAETAKYSDMEFEYNTNAPWQRKYQNDINKYVSNKNQIQAGISTWANGFAAFGGQQGTSKPMNEPTGQYNQQAMQQDAQNGQGMDYNGGGGQMPSMGNSQSMYS